MYASVSYRAGGSSSGRTPAFGAGYLGSIPSPPATFLQDVNPASFVLASPRGSTYGTEYASSAVIRRSRPSAHLAHLVYLVSLGERPATPLTPYVSPFTPLALRSRTSRSREQATECASLRRLSWHPVHGGPSGNLLEFLQSRLCQP